jgi:SanA protein
MKWFLRIFLSLLAIALVGLFSVAVINKYVYSQNSDKIKTSITEIPTEEEPKRVAIIFGARVWNDGSPSNSLYDRVLTGVELYRAGRIKKLLMSGDKTGENYDEPAAMKKLALELGVAEGDIILDGDGKRTYDTCDRAKKIFEVQKAILVTQDYHQPRALYLCNNLGVESIGITANRRAYDGERYYHFREFFSVASAWFEINFLSSEPEKGQKQPIQQ